MKKMIIFQMKRNGAFQKKGATEVGKNRQKERGAQNKFCGAREDKKGHVWQHWS